jgi:hypothetical protein
MPTTLPSLTFFLASERHVMPSYHKMTDIMPTSNIHFSVKLSISYAFDWVVLIIALVVSVVVGNLTPNKRAFSLVNPYISHVAHRCPLQIGFANFHGQPDTRSKGIRFLSLRPQSSLSSSRPLSSLAWSSCLCLEARYLRTHLEL